VLAGSTIRLRSSPAAALLVSRRLSMPRPVAVHAGAGGVPAALAGTPVEAVREEWVVEDGWWTRRPLRRRYFELVLGDGRNIVVFHDLTGGRWYVQRA
jgi:hypothetical protein